MESHLSWSVSGHQPHLLGGFSPNARERVLTLARRWVSRTQPTKVVSGMAAGWDMAVAAACVEADVPLVAALAWPGQGEGWPDEARAEFTLLLKRASVVHVHGTCRTSGMWTGRDQWVLGEGNAVVALWSGVEGGTARAIAHAVSLGMRVDNLWSEWEAMAADNPSGHVS